MWNQALWHWGSHSNPRGTEPRYSLAMEFQALPSGMRRKAQSAVEVAGEASENGDTDTEVHTSAAIGGDGSDEDCAILQHGLFPPSGKCNRDNVPHYNSPLHNPLELLIFEERLRLVAKQILQYAHMHSLSAGIRSLAEQLMSEQPTF